MIIYSFIFSNLILAGIWYMLQYSVSELTSCRQVYWTWYGATVSSPLISTLMCMRMAPDTADLSVRLSVRRGREVTGEQKREKLEREKDRS